jgi:hypothetical protein
MSKVNKSFTAGSVGVGGSGILLALFTWLFNPAEISEVIAAYPKIIIGLVCVLLVIICILSALLVKHQDTKIGNSQDLYEEGRTWKHTVLIVDDVSSVRAAIKDELQGFDVVDIERIDDYRLAAEFEIIISDIFDCSPGKTASSVLNTIKNKYPYKYVIPMSGQPGACEGVDFDSEIIYKDNKYKYVTQIRERIVTLSNKLDDVNKHWESVNSFLVDKKKSEKQIETIKSNYYRFVNKMQNGL